MDEQALYSGMEGTPSRSPWLTLSILGDWDRQAAGDHALDRFMQLSRELHRVNPRLAHLLSSTSLLRWEEIDLEIHPDGDGPWIGVFFSADKGEQSTEPPRMTFYVTRHGKSDADDLVIVEADWAFQSTGDSVPDGEIRNAVDRAIALCRERWEQICAELLRL